MKVKQVCLTNPRLIYLLNVAKTTLCWIAIYFRQNLTASQHNIAVMQIKQDLTSWRAFLSATFELCNSRMTFLAPSTTAASIRNRWRSSSTRSSRPGCSKFLPPENENSVGFRKKQFTPNTYLNIYLNILPKRYSWGSVLWFPRIPPSDPKCFRNSYIPRHPRGTQKLPSTTSRNALNERKLETENEILVFFLLQKVVGKVNESRRHWRAVAR